MVSEPVRKYLHSRGVSGPWSLDLPGDDRFPGGIIIPALAESESIPLLIESLCADKTLAESGFAVIFVVNNREDAAEFEKDDNCKALDYLGRLRGQLPFAIGIVDAATDGLSLPGRDGGVGLARKIGHDLLLPRLSFDGLDPVMVSLDCDTLVDPGYAAAVAGHFRDAMSGGAIIPFVHQGAASAEGEAAIVRYELFLRCYVAGLRFAGSPYAFHTVGSAMACRASAYMKCGGMNRRRAGEDFYFLQSLSKTSGVQQVAGAIVRPSARRSDRVPFGTGRSVGALLDRDDGAVLFHRPESFNLLGQWLELALLGCRNCWSDLPDRTADISPQLYEYLAEQRFKSAWDGFLRQNRDESGRAKAFHDWFDAFRTMKFLHFLADGPFPRCRGDEVVSAWPAVWGDAGFTMADRLSFLRREQVV